MPTVLSEFLGPVYKEGEGDFGARVGGGGDFGARVGGGDFGARVTLARGSPAIFSP